MCKVGGKEFRCDNCKPHAPVARRAMRAAERLYGKNNIDNRKKVAALDSTFVSGSIAERAAVVEASNDPEILRLAEADKPAVRAALLRNPNVAPKVLVEAATAEYSTANFDIIANPATPSDTLAGLTETGSPAVRAEAAKALVKRGESLDGFAGHSSAKIRMMVASSTRSRPIRDGLLEDTSTEVRERAVTNPSLARAPLPLSVASDRSPRVRETAAKSTRDRAVLAALTQDEDATVSAAARANPACPDAPQATRGPAPMKADTDVDALAVNPSAATTTLAAAYAHPSTTAGQKLALALNPFASDAMKRNHLDDKRFDSKRQALFAMQTEDAKSLVKLSKSRSLEVRAQVAQNPVTPRAILERLAGQSHPDVAAYAKETLNLV